MLRNSKTLMSGLCLAAVAAIIALIGCANPVNEPPLKWTMAMDIPVTNHELRFGELLNNLFDMDSMAVINADLKFFDTTLKFDEDGKQQYEEKTESIGDSTLIFSATKRDTTVFSIKEESSGDEIHQQELGPLPLASNPVSGPMMIGGSVDLPLTNIYRIQFSDVSPAMDVQLINTSGAAMSGVVASIGGAQSPPVDIQDGDTMVVQIPVVGRTFGSEVPVSVTGSPNGASLNVAFDVEGLRASSVDINDNMLADFHLSFVVDYEITDTVYMKYIDVLDGFFQYTIENQTGIDLKVGAQQHNLWPTSFSIGRGFESYEDLSNATLTGFAEDPNGGGDSAFYSGKLTEDGDVVVTAHTIRQLRQLNLSNTRMFPQWNDSTGKTHTRVEYNIGINARGNRVQISENDFVTVAIRALGYQFKEFYGVVKQPYEWQEEPIAIEIPFPWADANKDHLRGKFKLSDVAARVFVNTAVKEGSELERLNIRFRMSDPVTNTTTDTTIVLENVKQDASYLRTIDITDIVNQFPDSIISVITVSIDTGTFIRAVNDLTDPLDPDYPHYAGRMQMNANVAYQMNAYLDWEVAEAFTMDLGDFGIDTFEVPGALDLFRKMEDRRLSFEMWIRNNSNLNGRLYAILATEADNKMQELDGMSINQVHELITTPGAADAAGFINLMGDTGIYIPSRLIGPDSVHSAIVLTDAHFEKMFASDYLSWRWLKTFHKNPSDRATDTCNVKINSWISLSGINNTDSLLIWETGD